jgi:hypothetical protein
LRQKYFHIGTVGIADEAGDDKATAEYEVLSHVESRFEVQSHSSMGTKSHPGLMGTKLDAEELAIFIPPTAVTY